MDLFEPSLSRQVLSETFSEKPACKYASNCARKDDGILSMMEISGSFISFLMEGYTETFRKIAQKTC